MISRLAQDVQPVVIFFRKVSLLLLTTLVISFSLPARAVGSHRSDHDLSVSASLPTPQLGKAYTGQFSASGGSGTYRFFLSRGSLPPGLKLSATTGFLTGVPGRAGSYLFRISARDQIGHRGGASVTLQVASSNITITISPTSATVQSRGSQQFTAYVLGTSNTAVTWSTTSGQVSNRGMFIAPAVTTTTTALVTATSVANNTVRATATVTITAQSSALTITTTSIPAATAGLPYVAAVSASGGNPPYSWSLASGSLPNGILFNSQTGAFSGSSTQLGNFAFTVRVTDSAGNSATQGLSLLVSQAVKSSYTAFVEPRHGGSGFSVTNSNGTTGTIINYPSPLPNAGTNLGKQACYGNTSCIYGINTVFTDDSYPAGLRHRYVRITDATTGGATVPWVTADAGGAVVSNADSTVWLVKNQIINSFKLIQFDPVAFQVTGSLNITQTKITFHPSDPHIVTMYSGLTGTLSFGTLSTDDPSGNLSKGHLSLSVDHTADVSFYGPNCVPSSANISWSSIFRWSIDGSSVTLGVGPGQDLPGGTYWIVNYTMGKGLRCININPSSGPAYLVGEWGTGTPGPTYMQNPDGTLFAATMTLHSATQTHNPDWADWETNNCTAGSCNGPVFWNIPTLTLYRCDLLDPTCSSGHDVKGYFGMIHDHTNIMQPYANLAHAYKMTPFVWSDDHKTYWNNDGTDTKPVFMSNTKCWGSNPACGPELTKITNPFYFEITAVSPSNNQSGYVFRFGHTFASGLNLRFDAQYAIANIDRGGCFIAFGTDFLGRFGKLDSSDTLCNASVSGNQCRADVLIMDLCHAY